MTTETTSVYINGDRSVFLSKRAIDRLKKDIRTMGDPTKIESSNYVNDSHSLSVKVDNNSITVDIVSMEQFNRDEKKRKLRQMIRNGQKQRSGEMTQKMKSMKRTVPKNLFNSYRKAMAGFNFPLPSPSDVINDPERFKNQISLMMSQMGRVSNDVNASGAIKNYFKQLGDYLGIEPASMDMTPDTAPIEKAVPDGNETEDEDDEVPQLV